MEPNVTKFCLVCKDWNTALMQVKPTEFLCKECAEGFGHVFKEAKETKDPEKKKK